MEGPGSCLPDTTPMCTLTPHQSHSHKVSQAWGLAVLTTSPMCENMQHTRSEWPDPCPALLYLQRQLLAMAKAALGLREEPRALLPGASGTQSLALPSMVARAVLVGRGPHSNPPV